MNRMSYGLIITLLALMTIGTVVALAGDGDLPPDFSGTIGEWEGEFSIFPGGFDGTFEGISPAVSLEGAISYPG
jgi:hypothetical protein